MTAAGRESAVAVALNDEERHALDAARTMTPLTLHMVVETMIGVQLAAVLAALDQPAPGADERAALRESIRWRLDHFGPIAGDGSHHSRYDSPADAAMSAVDDFLTARAHQPTPPEEQP